MGKPVHVKISWNQDKKTIANTTPTMVATDEMPTADAPLEVGAAAPADPEAVAPVPLPELPVAAAPLETVGRAG